MFEGTLGGLSQTLGTGVSLVASGAGFQLTVTPRRCGSASWAALTTSFSLVIGLFFPVNIESWISRGFAAYFQAK